jgi:hypothetical protein
MLSITSITYLLQIQPLESSGWSALAWYLCPIKTIMGYVSAVMSQFIMHVVSYLVSYACYFQKHPRAGASYRQNLLKEICAPQMHIAVNCMYCLRAIWYFVGLI